MVSFKLEPKWRPLTAIYQNHSLSKNQKYWILNHGSMTRQLHELTDHQLQVERLKISWEQPRYGEQQSLNCSREIALIREVDLCCPGKLLLKGRTVIPLKFLNGKFSKIRHLGSRPLGEFLFSQPGLRRTRMRWCLLHPHQISFLSPTPLVARESIFELDHKALLLIEFFMPDLLGMIA